MDESRRAMSVWAMLRESNGRPAGLAMRLKIAELRSVDKRTALHVHRRVIEHFAKERQSAGPVEEIVRVRPQMDDASGTGGMVD